MQYNTEIFIEKARLKHGDKYDYSKVEYTGSRKKVIIICPEHGEFRQEPVSHLRGCGCKECACPVYDTDKFISKANIIHGNKYYYSLVEYSHGDNEIDIICPIHGAFKQKAKHHLRGHGCNLCRYNIPDKDTFLDEANKIHGCKYDYSRVSFNLSQDKITIICPDHGNFEQTVRSHLDGHGCHKCGYIQANSCKKNVGTTNEFLKRARLKHGDKYDYSKVEYTGSSNKVTIICPEHGEFEQRPDGHLAGHGCASCGAILPRDRTYDKKEHQLIEGEERKYCKHCDEWLELSSFSKCKKEWDGLQYRCKECTAIYRKKNRLSLNKKLAERRKDPEVKLINNIRTRVRQALKGTPKESTTMNLVGCSIETLREHLESQFAEGMTWDNHRTHGWHIDHIRPCSSFDLSDPEQQKECFHYTNLQPLWWWENLEKGDKIL
jgi:hypothetical protein